MSQSIVRVKGASGLSVEAYAQMLVRVCQNEGTRGNQCIVVGMINEIEIRCHPGRSAHELIEQYNQKARLISQELLISEKGDVGHLDSREEANNLQQRMRILLSQLPRLNLGDVKEVLDWFYELQPSANSNAVTFDPNYIVQIFAANGFVPEMYVGTNVDTLSAEHRAYYIIGQCLSFLSGPGYIHPVIRTYINDWRKIHLEGGR